MTIAGEMIKISEGVTLFLHEQSASEAVDEILRRASAMNVSDIHIDPRHYDILVRFRVDGIMQDICLLEKRLHEEIISRLKILSGTRTDLHNLPQDGRWKANIESKSFNIRISFMPTYHGENAVVRLLPIGDASRLSLAELGFTREHIDIFDRSIKRPNGLILVTGPTGCGKTTTLHAFLSMKSQEPVSVITLEDPVEYEIPGARQVHVRHSLGMSFASGLRAALRQDPDVIMVGEIRDSETAKIALHTALTGHLVFSTLHTNSALESIPRLVDMGMDGYLLASTLRLIVSQRLVRKVCRECGGEGCEACRNSGYRDRSVIAEVCQVDTGMSDLISKNEPVSSLHRYAVSKGFRNIHEDGQEKIDWGMTTASEVARVLEE